MDLRIKTSEKKMKFHQNSSPSYNLFKYWQNTNTRYLNIMMLEIITLYQPHYIVNGLKTKK